MKITGIELAIVVLAVLALFGWLIRKHDQLDKAQLAREKREREEAVAIAKVKAEADARRDAWNRAQAERTARRNAGLPVETTYELYLDAVREESQREPTAADIADENREWRDHDAAARTLPRLGDWESLPKPRAPMMSREELEAMLPPHLHPGRPLADLLARMPKERP